MATKSAKKPARKTAAKATSKADEKAGLFVQEYLLDLNATKAAIRSGFSAKTA